MLQYRHATAKSNLLSQVVAHYLICWHCAVYWTALYCSSHGCTSWWAL